MVPFPEIVRAQLLLQHSPSIKFSHCSIGNCGLKFEIVATLLPGLGAAFTFYDVMKMFHVKHFEYSFWQ